MSTSPSYRKQRPSLLQSNIFKEEHLFRHPWKSNCVPTWPEGFRYSWQPYSKSLCKTASLFIESLTICGCYPTYGSTNGILEYDLTHDSGCYTAKQLECLETLENNLSNGTHVPKMLSQCSPRCISAAYEVFI